MVKKLLECRYLLLHCVAAVIDEDVDPWYLLPQLLQKIPVRLRTDENTHIAFLEDLASRVDIHPAYSRVQAKILFPHLQAAALGHTNLDYHNVLASPARKMPVINVEVMMPLVNQAPGVGSELLLEFIHVSMDSSYA